MKIFTIALILLGGIGASGLFAGQVESGLELEWSPDLNDWQSLPVRGDMLSGDGGILHLGDDEDRGFFRLRIRAVEREVEPVTFVRIPAGTFTMGSPSDEPGHRASEAPQHQVTISTDFFMARTPVTWNQWIGVRMWAAENGYTELPIGYKGSHGDARNSGNESVTMTSWWDATQWLNAWSEMEGRTPVYYSSPEFGEENVIRTGSSTTYADWSANGYRLPTEAEWEYACRAGTTTAFNTGPITYIADGPLDPNLDRAGWYVANSERRTHSVRQKEPNAWGLYDMHGNVWEWCWNVQESYTSSAKTDPRGPALGTNRIRRGGSWAHSARHSRSAHRVFSGPFNRFNYVGFRPVVNDVQ